MRRLALPVTAVLWAGSVHAQQDVLEEVLVTAERRSADIQSTATSVSVRSGVDLRNEGKYSLQSILEDVPGIVGGAATATGSSESSGTDALATGLTIRGIQSNAGAGGSITSTAPAAAIYVDGVYEGVGGGYDIERVEALRGPQGTLYGRSATSGLVAIHTFNPHLSELGFDATLEAGNYSMRHYTAVLNAPLVDDKLAVRVAANRYERDGYDSAEGGAYSNTDARVKVLYQPSDTLSILVGLAMQDNKTHTGGVNITLVAPDEYLYSPSPIGPGENKYRQYWAELNWDLSFATLTYMPAFRSWESQAVNYARLPVLRFDQTLSTPLDEFWTHELRFASNSGSPIAWQVGALYYDNKLENHNRVDQTSPVPGGYNSDASRRTTATGAFAEATFPLNDSWRLTGGVRYDSTEVDVSQVYTLLPIVNPVSLEQTRRFNNFTYKARIEHDLSSNHLLYASVSTGFSPGDVTLTTGVGANGLEVVPIVLQDQTLTAYEIGSKNRFLGDTLQINGSAYYYDYGGYQTAAINIGNPASPTFTTLTTPLEVYGAELELMYQLTSQDRVSFDLAYTNPRYVDKESVVVANGLTFADFFARDTVAGVAPWTANASYEHIFPLPRGGNVSVRADARYLSAHEEGRLTPTDLQMGRLPFVQVDDEVVGNLSATWSSGDHYSVTGYVRNIGDNRYKTHVNIVGSDISTYLYDPRTYGVMLNVSF